MKQEQKQHFWYMLTCSTLDWGVCEVWSRQYNLFVLITGWMWVYNGNWLILDLIEITVVVDEFCYTCLEEIYGLWVVNGCKKLSSNKNINHNQPRKSEKQSKVQQKRVEPFEHP